MIKPAVLNFLREKMQEGADYTALYTQLKELASLDFAGEQKRFDAVKAARLKTEDEHKAAQERVSKAAFDLEAAQHERDKTLKEANAIIANAETRAKQILAETELRSAQSVKGWDKAISDRQDELKALDAQVKQVDVALGQLHGEYSDLKQKHDTLASKHDQLLGALAAMKSSL